MLMNVPQMDDECWVCPPCTAQFVGVTLGRAMAKSVALPWGWKTQRPSNKHLPTMGPLHNKLGLISSVSKQLRLGILLKLSNVDLVSDFKVDATSRSDQKTPKGSRKIHGKLHGKYMEIYRLEIHGKIPEPKEKKSARVPVTVTVRTWHRVWRRSRGVSTTRLS